MRSRGGELIWDQDPSPPRSLLLNAQTCVCSSDSVPSWADGHVSIARRSGRAGVGVPMGSQRQVAARHGRGAAGPTD